VLTVQSWTSLPPQDGLQDEPVNAELELKDAQQRDPVAQLVLSSHVRGA